MHGATPGVLPYYQKMTHSLYCVGIEAVSALDCWAIGLPGFQGLALAPGPAPRMGYTAANLAAHGWGQVVHFPDGNATVARALVRDLVPEAVPGTRSTTSSPRKSTMPAWTTLARTCAYD